MDSTQKNNHLAISAIVSEFYDQSKHCDVTIEIEDRVFRSHRLLLAAASEYFDVMFSGSFKEGIRYSKMVGEASEPIMLRNIDASAFNEVLQFLYKGKIQITESNVHTLLYTSDFLGLRNSYIEDECIKFLKTSAKPVPSALEILSLGCATGKKTLVDLLSAHIFKHFAHFSADEGFLDLSFDCLNVILKNKQRLSLSNEDALLQTICRWINHSREKRKQHRGDLMKNLDASKLSGTYVSSLIEEYEHFIDEIVTSTNKSRASSPVFFDAYPSDGRNDIEIKESELHVFTKTSTRNRNLVKIFSLDKSNNQWSLTSEFDSTSTSMRNIALDNTLYCLAYDCYEYPPPHFHGNFNSQSFTMHESICGPAKRFLTNPPIIMSRFELCGMENNIYVYNKSLFHTQDLDMLRNFNERTVSFTREELLRDIFNYNRELDKWFPVAVPSTQTLFHQDVSSLTVANNTLYFVGGDADSDNVHVLGYDPRTMRWNSMPGTPAEFGSSYYKQIQCCANQDHIYMAGLSGRQIFVWTYDLVAGNWMPDPVIMWEPSKYGFGKFLVDDNDLMMIPVSRPFNIETYDTVSQKIKSTWSLEETIRKFGKSYILDAVIF